MTEDLLSRSRYALLTGDLPRAESLCSKLIENEPRNSAGLLLLGGIYIRQAKLQSAQKIFETLIDIEPENPDAWINLALVNRKRGRLKTALNAAQKAYNLAGNRADIIFNIGNIHKNLGELAKAEQIYRLAIQKQPDFMPSYNNLALLLSSGGRNAEAAGILKQGLSIDENNPSLHFSLGNLFAAEGKTAKAASEYRTALKINPGWEECLLNLGDLIKNEDPYEAKRIFNKVIDLSPELPDAQCRIGEIEFINGDAEKAGVIFTKLLAERPEYTPAAVNLAAVYREEKRLPEAEKLLREHQEIEPENLELRLMLGNILLELGKYNEAFSNIRFVLDRNPDESRAWFAMARQYSLSGKKDRALNTYRKGLNIAPDSHEARLQLTLLLKSLGKTDAAVNECEYIHRKSPGDFAPALLLAELYIEQEKYRKAAGILEDLIAASPEDFKLLQMYAETAGKAGYAEKALQAAEKLTAMENEFDTDFDIDALNENLRLYDEMAVEYAREYGNRWSKNLKTLAGIIDYKPREHEEASFILEGLQDIAGEYVPILDVGGIDPVILFDEEEETLTLTDEDEFIPPPEEDEEEPEEIEKHEEITANQTVSQPAPQPAAPLNFGSPLTIKLETPPIIVRQAPPEPEPEPEPEPPVEEPEVAEEPEEEEEIITPSDPERPEDADNLFGYLDKLTRFLPADKRKEYIGSDARLKLAALKARMDGDPGLISRISSRRDRLGEHPESKTVKLTKSRIGNTLNFMTGLAEALPDNRIAESLGDRLKNILSRLESEKEKVDDRSD